MCVLSDQIGVSASDHRQRRGHERSAKVKAIVDMPQPKDLSDLRQFGGIVNQVMQFCLHVAEITQSLRDQFKKGSTWLWGDTQQRAFKKTESRVSILALYDPEKETAVSADASSYGLGEVLLQNQPSGEMRTMAYASRYMTKTERRYVQIEKEALATT